jgi:hypothetical protein
MDNIIKMKTTVYKCDALNGFIKPVKLVPDGISTFVDCTIFGETIIKKRDWSSVPQEQARLVSDVSKLILIS